MNPLTLTTSQRMKAAAIGATAGPLVRGLCRTLRWTVEGSEHWETVIRSGRQPILALWHGRIFAGLHYFRDRGVVVITSRNFDGEWVARILGRFGFRTARGSTSQGGARALIQLRRQLNAGHPVAFTVDGPRGPARVAQRGAVWLSGATGHPILPFHIEARDSWTLPSWDAAQIPKPWTRVALVIGEPMQVRGTDLDTVECERLALERRLEGLEARASALARPGIDVRESEKDY
jgi:lysophospholipid acyltransferase (LPLAT)-like uncharacterized protein